MTRNSILSVLGAGESFTLAEIVAMVGSQRHAENALTELMAKGAVVERAGRYCLCLGGGFRDGSRLDY